MTAQTAIRRSVTRGPEARITSQGCRASILSPELEGYVRHILLHGVSRSDPVEKTGNLQSLCPPSVERDSLVYRLTVNGTGKTFILKQHNSRHDPRRAEACAEREYEVLVNLARELPRYSHRFRVPEVVGFFPGNHAILMTECPGESFARQLRWARLRHIFTERVLLQGAASCGEWLGLFHRASRQSDTKSEKVRRKIECMFRNDLRSCAQLGLENSIVSRASDLFSKHYPVVFEAAVKYAGHHGDFGPHNVFLSPECVTAIDFEGFRIGLPGEDVADFLVLLNLLPFYHAAAPLRRRLRRAFLEGYLTQHHSGFESLEFLEVQALVKRMAHNPQLKWSARGRIGQKRRRLLEAYTRYFESLLP